MSSFSVNSHNVHKNTESQNECFFCRSRCECLLFPQWFNRKRTVCVRIVMIFVSFLSLFMCFWVWRPVRFSGEFVGISNKDFFLFERTSLRTNWKNQWETNAQQMMFLTFDSCSRTKSQVCPLPLSDCLLTFLMLNIQEYDNMYGRDELVLLQYHKFHCADVVYSSCLSLSLLASWKLFDFISNELFSGISVARHSLIKHSKQELIRVNDQIRDTQSITESVNTIESPQKLVGSGRPRSAIKEPIFGNNNLLNINNKTKHSFVSVCVWLYCSIFDIKSELVFPCFWNQFNRVMAVVTMAAQDFLCSKCRL